MVNLFNLIGSSISGAAPADGQRAFFSRPFLLQPDDAPTRAERDATILRSGDRLELDEAVDEPRFVSLVIPPYF